MRIGVSSKNAGKAAPGLLAVALVAAGCGGGGKKPVSAYDPSTRREVAEQIADNVVRQGSKSVRVSCRPQSAIALSCRVSAVDVATGKKRAGFWRAIIDRDTGEVSVAATRKAAGR